MTHFIEFGTWLFGGDYPQDRLLLHQIAARALAVALIGLMLLRLGKSRVLGQSTSLDVIVGIVLGSLLSRAITGTASISGSTVACGVIIAAHWALTALDCRFEGFARFFKGNALVVVEDGKVLEDCLKSSHLSQNDLLSELRMAGVEDVSDVRRAYKERTGRISVMKREPQPAVVEIAVRQGVQTVRIELH